MNSACQGTNPAKTKKQNNKKQIKKKFRESWWSAFPESLIRDLQNIVFVGLVFFFFSLAFLGFGIIVLSRTYFSKTI